MLFFLSKYRFPILLLVIYAIYIAFGIHLFQKSSVIEYPDSEDYHSVTLQGLSSIDFWAGKRSLTTPIVWRMLQTKTEDNLIPGKYVLIPPFYTTLSFLSWGMLAFSLAFILRTTWLRLLAFTFILGLGLSRAIFFWNWTLLSESLAISSFVLILTFGIIILSLLKTHPSLSQKNQIILGAGISFLIPLWSFTRDTNVFIGIGFVGFLTLLFIIRWKVIKTKMLLAILIITFFSTALCQMATIDIGKRWQYPFMNVFSQRILPNPEYRQFFIQHGLPDTPQVMRFSGQWANSYNGDWAGLNKWLKKKARSTYYQFLLTHPNFAFLEPLHHSKELLDGDWTSYGKNTVNNGLQNILSHFVWPHGFYLLVMILSSMALIFTCTLRRCITPHILFAITILFLVLPGVFATWHGDAMEIIRHSVGNSLQLRLGLVLVILFCLDTLMVEKNSKLAKQPLITERK